MQLSNVDWLSWIGYSPRREHDSELDRKAKSIVYRYLKTTRIHELLDKCHFAENGELHGVTEHLLGKFFPEGCIVVPMPSSAKRMDGKEQHWGALELCNRAVAKGLAADCEELLERTETVPKSHLQKRNERVPAAKHYETMRATKGGLGVKRSFTIVDDVITRGATLIGAAARLRESFPQSTIRGFAFARTLIGPCVEHLPDPLEGYVEIYPSGSTFRHPEE